MRVPIKLDLLGSVGHVTRSGTGCGKDAWAGREWGDSGDIYERGDVILIKHQVRAGMFDLIVHLTGEIRDGLLNLYLGATARLNDINKAPGL